MFGCASGLPGISHRLRDQEEHRAKRTESAESSIHAVESGQSSEAKECRGAGPVARQSEAVLRGRKSAVGQVEGASGRGASCSPIRHAQRGQQDPSIVSFRHSSRSVQYRTRGQRIEPGQRDAAIEDRKQPGHLVVEGDRTNPRLTEPMTFIPTRPRPQAPSSRRNTS